MRIFFKTFWDSYSVSPSTARLKLYYLFNKYTLSIHYFYGSVIDTPITFNFFFYLKTFRIVVPSYRRILVFVGLLDKFVHHILPILLVYVYFYISRN